jgi:FkbM family methyltransferase
MKVLLDVGANTGQSAREAIHPRYGFDKIWCFEPAPACWPEIESIGDERIELCKYGLSNLTCEKKLYGQGGLAATIFPDTTNLAKSEVDSNGVTIQLIRATEWFKEHIGANDLVFVKLNCEGSECDTVDDLLDSGELRKAYNVMIDFDVRFIPSLRSREIDVRRRLRRNSFSNVAFSDDVMSGATHEARLRNWLELVGAHEQLPLDELRRKYDSVLKRLSSRTGRRKRMKLALRRAVFERLPPQVQDVTRMAWRRIRALRS